MQLLIHAGIKVKTMLVKEAPDGKPCPSILANIPYTKSAFAIHQAKAVKY